MTQTKRTKKSNLSGPTMETSETGETQRLRFDLIFDFLDVLSWETGRPSDSCDSVTQIFLDYFFLP